jgi:hypothetical protein
LTCQSRVGDQNYCESTSQCLSPLTCSLTQVTFCECTGVASYYDAAVSSTSCSTKVTINQACSTTILCRTDLDLECVNNICQCISEKPVWSVTANKCSATCDDATFKMSGALRKCYKVFSVSTTAATARTNCRALAGKIGKDIISILDSDDLAFVANFGTDFWTSGFRSPSSAPFLWRINDGAGTVAVGSTPVAAANYLAGTGDCLSFQTQLATDGISTSTPAGYIADSCTATYNYICTY